MVLRKTNKKATIILCVLNKKETIGRCLDSILKLQGDVVEELLVVDGGSKDGSWEIVKRYKNYPKIKMFQVSGGYSRQLNYAIHKALGAYIALTDADCVVDKKWLIRLLDGFKENDVVATAGYCGTPKDVSLLQQAIGIELETRFKKFPLYLERAPTMSLCVKSEIAKNLLFDEDIKVGVETDFGYRLNKLGKIKYVAESIVWHYHRANWNSYFKQQWNTARGAFWVYIKHPKKVSGDHITTPMMIWQVVNLSLFLLFITMSWLIKFPVEGFLITGLVFTILVAIEIIRIKPNARLLPTLLGIYLVRNFAFILGLIEGVFLLIFNKKERQKFKL